MRTVRDWIEGLRHMPLDAEVFAEDAGGIVQRAIGAIWTCEHPTRVVIVVEGGPHWNPVPETWWPEKYRSVEYRPPSLVWDDEPADPTRARFAEVAP